MGKKKKRNASSFREQVDTREVHIADGRGLGRQLFKLKIHLVTIFILALSIRLVYLDQLIATPVFQGLAADSEQYESFAYHILDGKLTDKNYLYLNPFYPFFLALIYFLFGYNNLFVVVIQGIIDSISCLIIYYIASLLFNKKVALLAALIYIFYGIAIFYTGILLAPTLIIFITLLFIALLLKSEEKWRLINFFTSGILFGFTVLAIPHIMLFLLFLPLWFFTGLKGTLGMRKSVQGFVLLAVGFLMVNSIIIIRNYSIEKSITMSTLGGINFYIGNNPKATGRFIAPHGVAISPIEEIKTSIRYAERETGRKLNSSQASDYWLSQGLKFIRDKPLDALSLYVKKFALFWRKEEIMVNIDYNLSKTFIPLFQLPLISFGMIAPFAILGTVFCLINKHRKSYLIALYIFTFMLSVIIFFISDRYRLPIVPFLIVFSSYGLYRFVEVITAIEMKHMVVFGMPLILLFVMINMPFEYFKLPLQASHFNNLGKIYSEEGRLDDAYVELKKALSISSENAEAHYNLGSVCLKKGLIAESINEFQEALKINPDYVDAYNNLGNVYTRENRLDEAILQYKRALDIDPNHTEANNNLGVIYLRKGRLDEAISQFDKALDVNPRYAQAYANLGITYTRKGLLGEAITQYQRALSIDPTFQSVYEKLGSLMEAEGRLSDAISMYREAIYHNPEHYKAYNSLAWIYATSRDAHMRDGKEAVILARKACELTRFEIAEVVNTLAAAYAENGDFVKATEYQQRAIEAAPFNAREAFTKTLEFYKSGQAYWH